jgi:predicted  nucleic acid-binding Zn ribbon protein
VKEYLQLSQDSLVLLKLPYLAKNQDEFRAIEKSALAFTLPTEHAKDWEETRLGKRIGHVRKEYESLHAALAGEEKWMRSRIDADTTLLKQGAQIYGKLLNRDKLEQKEVENWQKQYGEHMNPKPPMPREDLVKGVTRLTYEDLGKFEQVQKAKKDWDASKRKLTNMAKSIDAEAR